MDFATWEMRASQSGGGIGVVSVILSLYSGVSTLSPSSRNRNDRSYFCACTASNINNALLKFLPLSLAILSFNPVTTPHPSFLPACAKTLQISTLVGAATLTNNVLDLIGAMIFAVLFANKINRKFGLYFSIVLLNAACASLVK